MSFICPSCRQVASRVYDSRHNDGGQAVRRRRKCSCGYKFTTYEITSDAYSKLEAIGRAASTLATIQQEASRIEVPSAPPKSGLRPRLYES
jgi:hypothetical protein